jgi:hypothetical protein
MKKIFLIVITILVVTYFIPAKATYPPLKTFWQVGTTGEYIYEADSIHNFYNDLTRVTSNGDTVPGYNLTTGLFEYDFFIRNDSRFPEYRDTMFVDFYQILQWSEVGSIDYDTVWHSDTVFTVHPDTNWIHHYDINTSVIDSTVLYTYNTSATGRFKVDTLGNQNMKYRGKDQVIKVFKQVNKN